MEKGFIRVGAVVPNLKVANIKYNVAEIINQLALCEQNGIEIAVFPELSISGYSCQDMFLNGGFISKVYEELLTLCDQTKQIKTLFVVGAGLAVGGRLYNCAVVIYKGKICGVVPKTFLPNSAAFYEKRWFSSALDCTASSVKIGGQLVPFGRDLVFRLSGEVCLGVEICEDLWSVTPPSDDLALNGANIILNLSASNEVVGKAEYRKNLVKMQSAKTLSAYVYTSSGVNETTADVIFGGHALIAENGTMLSENQRFNPQSNLIYADVDYEFINSERQANKTFASCIARFTARVIDVPFEPREFVVERKFKRLPFVPSESSKKQRCEEIITMQSYALAKRMQSAKAEKLVIGVSGGLDSTLALLVCERAVKILGLPNTNIIAVTMAGFGTTSRTSNNAIRLMQSLNTTIRKISIVDACNQHFKDIGLVEQGSLAYENAQARERTQILFDIANMQNALVVGTGDMSELSLGWCTYNGDHMSSYAVNSGVPKTLVKYIVEAVAEEKRATNKLQAEILLDIVATPISPELLPSGSAGNIAQKTEEIVGSYEVNDFILYHFLRRKSSQNKIRFLVRATFGLSESETAEVVKNFFKRFFANQFKRSCVPDGVKIGTVSLSPRGDLCLPSDLDGSLWID